VHKKPVPVIKLIIEDDEGKTTVVPLSRDAVTIGRKEGNTIRLTERNVSRRHARILRQDGMVYVEDLGSYNGVRVNGNRIAGRVPVHEGDRIQIGDYLLGIKVDKSQEAKDPFEDQKTVPMPLPPSMEGEVPGQADLADTVQMGPVASQEAKPSKPARLVVVSQNFFGKTFPLDKAALVIGRTEENDIVLDHRSVSRHHAKIVREKGRYTIVDLQSANGVRVNGEEYGKVELRRGDIIDLGHVRLRFVDPDEDFVPDRDVTMLVAVPGEQGSKKGLVVGVVALAILVGGAFGLRGVLWGPRSQGGGTAQGNVAQGGASGSTGLLPNATEATAKDAGTRIAAQGQTDLSPAEKLMKEERWADAVRFLSDVLQKDPSNELARDKRARAVAEQQNQDALTVMSEAVDQGDPDRAYDAFKKVPEDSVYKKRADDLWARVRPAFVKRHTLAAKKLKADGKCEAMQRELQLLEVVDALPPDAANLRRECKEQGPAVALVPKGQPKEPRPPKDLKTGGEEPQAAAGLDDVRAKELVDEAAVAFARGQNAQAITLAQQATRLTKKQGLLYRAYATMALGHCSLGRKDQAQKLATKLDGAWKAQVKSGCRSKGIELE